MSDTLANIKLPASTWVDLYTHPTLTDAGVSVGQKLIVNNLYLSDVKLCSQASEPDADSGFVFLEGRGSKVNESGDSGAWVYSDVAGLINVGIV
ncbi:hypothetical protein [Marinicellulosiphila megalodicopiae]|uniref:hypothetical protein n=1 Tax=Marinicellulosiphila megalodicopiae TaxID=2724896 RepID=UPI003BB1FEA0